MDVQGRGKPPVKAPPKTTKKPSRKKAEPKLTAKEKAFIEDFGEMLRAVEADKVRKLEEEEASTPAWQRWLRRHRPLLAYALLAVAGSVGFWRVETAIHEERDTRQKFDAAEAREEREEMVESLNACKFRNAFQLNTRSGDSRIVDAFKLAFLAGADTPEEQQGIIERAEEARAYVLAGRSAQDEDRDCNKDGTLDAEDYYNPTTDLP